MALAKKSNPAEAEALIFGQMNSDSGCGGDGIRHQAFSAGFVDGRAIAIGYPATESHVSRGDSGRDPGRPAADYENVCVKH